MAMAAANDSAVAASSGHDVRICHGCSEVISGSSTYIRVGTANFHTEHFVCVTCGQALHGTKFFNRRGEFYCKTDFEKLFLHICRACNNRIMNGRVTRALDGYYHPEHFCCTTCGVRLDGKFYNHENKPYCQIHASQPTERCARCGEDVKTEEIVRASGKIYHNRCLSCHNCLRPLAKSGSMIFRKDDRLYCQQDYQELFSHRCTSCGDPILVDCIAVNAEFYHAKCFRCAQCGTKLDKYLSIGGELRCSDHISASTMRVSCSVCKEAIPVHTVVAAVGAKFHIECFRCSFCQKQLEKVSAKLRDKLICCPDCLITSSVSPSLPNKESGLNRQIEARVQSVLRPYKFDVETIPVAPLAQPSKLRQKTVELEPTSSLQSLPAGMPLSGMKERRRISPRLSSGIGRLHRKTHTWSQIGQSGGNGAPSYETKLEWRKGEMIGKGSFGKVYMGMLVTGELIAVKQVELTTFEDKERANQLQSEINLMKRLKHPNIVSLLGTEQDATKFNILMEYVPGKSIDVLLESFGVFQEETIRMYTAQLLSALEYMHRNDVIHRDIKGKNVLVDTAGNLKLADFGSAKQFENILSKEAPSIGYNYTPLWTAPEVLLGNYGRKVDIWSLGCVLIEMATAASPWAECNFDNPFRALYHIGNSNAIPKIPTNLSDCCQDFIRVCLTRAPDDRPDAKDLMSHAFMAENFIEKDEDTSGSESEENVKSIHSDDLTDPTTNLPLHPKRKSH